MVPFMPDSNAVKRTRTRARRATTQTIEQIEAREAEVAAAERAAVCQIAELLRELAVTLPAESKLPVRFAKTARMLDERGGSEVGNSLAAYDVGELATECSKDLELGAAVATIRALEMFPAVTVHGEKLRGIIPHLRQMYGLDAE